MALFRVCWGKPGADCQSIALAYQLTIAVLLRKNMGFGIAWLDTSLASIYLYWLWQLGFAQSLFHQTSGNDVVNP